MRTSKTRLKLTVGILTRNKRYRTLQVSATHCQPIPQFNKKSSITRLHNITPNFLPRAESNTPPFLEWNAIATELQTFIHIQHLATTGAESPVFCAPLLPSAICEGGGGEVFGTRVHLTLTLNYFKVPEGRGDHHPRSFGLLPATRLTFSARPSNQANFDVRSSVDSSCSVICPSRTRTDRTVF